VVQLVVDTPEGISLRYEIAGAGSRGAAAALDLMLFTLGFLSLGLAALTLAQLDPTGLSGFVLGLLAGGFLICLSAYHIGFALLWEGRSPGKRLLGLRVVDQQGNPAGPVQHLVRGLFWPLETFLALPLSLGLILIAATERRQRLGDLVAGTLVLREIPAPDEQEPFMGSSWSGLERKRLDLTPAVAARFDAEDLLFLRKLFTRRSTAPEARGRLFVKSARHYASVLEIELPERLRPEQAAVLLRELFLYLRELRGS
jgi:uncharacterized RDD family membrane protein YckC